MGIFPRTLAPELMLRLGIIVSGVASVLLLALTLTSAGAFAVLYGGGLGMGFIFTSYEIMVPEVILWYVPLTQGT
jgi:hypothetical protein